MNQNNCSPREPKQLLAQRGLIAVIGVTFLIVRLFDGFLDPVFGYLSDIVRVPILGRSVWLLISTPILIVSVWNLYMPDPKGFPSTEYFIRYHCSNELGDWSEWSYPPTKIKTQPPRCPDRMRHPEICTPETAIATIATWIPPYDGGSKIMRYEIRGHVLNAKTKLWEEYYWYSAGSSNSRTAHPSLPDA